MNILIVSFDKSLVSKLKELLGEHNVLDVKNGEEAIDTVSPYMDVVIYDAVSGSISEEDINNMYRQKFKEAKYIILVDDLFPVDMNNIIPPKKVKVNRDEALNRISSALLEEPVRERPQSPMPEKVAEPIFESGLSLEEHALQKAGMEETFSFRELELSIPRKKLLIVSFDTSLTNKIKEALSDRLDIVEAKNVREAAGKAKEADIILFDTISGMLAHRTLMDMSKDESLAKKPYVLLIDELFTIDVESVPLQRKYTFAREAELSKAIAKVKELAEEVPIEYTKEEVPDTYLTKGALPVELQPAPLQEEDKSIMSLLEEMISSGIEEAKVVPEQPKVPESLPHMEDLVESLATAIKNVIIEQLSEEKVSSILLNVLKPEEIFKQLSYVLERKLEEVLREKVSEFLSSVDVSKIVREEAYRVLKERLRELIT